MVARGRHVGPARGAGSARPSPSVPATRSMIGAVVGLALPIGATWLGLRACGLRRASDSTAVTGAVACGLGLALAAVGTFATLTLGGHLSPLYAALDGGV